MFITFPYRPKHLQLKFYTIMQDSKRVLGFNCKKRIEQLNFLDWLWNDKKSSSLKWLWTRAKCDPMGFKYFFSKKIYKNRPAAGGFAPRPP